MGINPKDLADIEQLPGDDLWKIIQGGDPKSVRNVAKGQLAVKRAFFESGRLGILVDGTGREYGKIAAQKEKMEKLGYDTAMVFVNTSLDVAQQRNANRARVLPRETIEDLWNAVQNNLKAYAQLFGNDFTIVMNDKPGAPPKAAVKAIRDFVKAPVKNKIGKAWIEGELERRGVKTLEPGGAEGFRGDKASAERIRQMRSEQRLSFDVLKILEEEGFIEDGEDNMVHAEKAFFAARVMRWIRNKVQTEPDFNLQTYLTMLMYYKTDMADLKFSEDGDKLLYKMKNPDQEIQEIVDSLIKSSSERSQQPSQEGEDTTSTTEDVDGASDT